MSEWSKAIKPHRETTKCFTTTIFGKTLKQLPLYICALTDS